MTPITPSITVAGMLLIGEGIDHCRRKRGEFLPRILPHLRSQPPEEQMANVEAASIIISTTSDTSVKYS